MGRRWTATIALVAAGLVGATLADPLAFVADDSWFYLVIGRNVVAGRGVTFSGTMPTNGFQPLWQAVVAAVLVVTNALGLRSPEAEVRAVLLAAAALLGASLAALASLLRRFEVPAAGVAAVLLGVAILLGGVLGTIASEANLLVLLLVLAVRSLVDLVRSPWPGSTGAAARFGVLLGLVVLARLDSGFVAVAALVALVALARWSLVERVRVAAVAGGAAALVVVPYLVWNVVRFGHLFPIAGAIKVRPGGFLGNPDAVGTLGWSLLALVVVGAAVAWWGRRPTRAELAAVGAPFAGAVVSTAIYLAWAPGRFTDLDWYKMPQLVAAALVGALVLRRVAGWSPTLASAAPLAVALLLVPAAGYLAVERRIRGANHHFWHPVADFSREAGDAVEPGAPIATVDFPGVLAMYSDRPVVALDGLTGDFAFQDALRDRGASCALAEQGVRYLVVETSKRLEPVVGRTGTYEVLVGSWLHDVPAGRLELDERDRVLDDRASDLSLWRLAPTCP